MKAISVTESILIGRPADEVFAYVANYENNPKRRAGVWKCDNGRWTTLCLNEGPRGNAIVKAEHD